MLREIQYCMIYSLLDVDVAIRCYPWVPGPGFWTHQVSLKERGWASQAPRAACFHAFRAASFIAPTEPSNVEAERRGCVIAPRSSVTPTPTQHAAGAEQRSLLCLRLTGAEREVRDANPAALFLFTVNNTPAAAPRTPLFSSFNGAAPRGNH